jgi:glutathionyl-hydroquinone reductase
MVGRPGLYLWRIAGSLSKLFHINMGGHNPMKPKTYLVLLLLAATLFVGGLWQGCASTPTPQDQVTFMMSLYNQQYDAYQRQAAWPDLTDTEKSILRAKKEILTQAHGLIALYDSYVTSGKTAPADLQEQIMALLDEVQRKVVR